ncbi:MAG: hypothetical protein JOZ73_03580 [Solirubrobacterales bacterium]|nr:hypothetical protein [Solirubrobacterales bacterium]
MSDRPSPIDLEEFELIPAAPGTALLRVTARVPAWASREPTLLIRDEARVHRLRPLPSPREPEGWLRAAYSVRTGVFERNPSFALELSQGAVLELPEPRGVNRRPLQRQEARSRPETPRSQPPDRSSTRDAGERRTEAQKLIQLQARVLEANRWALAAQREAERLTARVRELERALEESDGIERIRHAATAQARARDEADVRAALSARRRRP